MSKEKTFSQFVQGGLKKSSISLRQLCRESKTDPSFLSKVLRGKLPPPTDERLLKRLARALGLDPLTLIISTGMIPLELRSDPEMIKSILEGIGSLRAKSTPPPARVKVPAIAPAFQTFRSPQLSEDLL